MFNFVEKNFTVDKEILYQSTKPYVNNLLMCRNTARVWTRGWTNWGLENKTISLVLLADISACVTDRQTETDRNWEK